MEASRSRRWIPPIALIGAAITLSFSCHRVAGIDGVSPATPHPDGHACNNPVECASFSCENGVCAAPPPGYVEIDGDCSGGDPCVGDATCDEGICVGDKRACAAEGQACLVDSDCCDSDCMNDVCGFLSCTSDGDFCAYSDECCNGYCDTDSETCGGSSPSCGDDGASCFGDSECCSGYCDSNAGECSTCSLGSQGSSCFDDSDCCSGFCSSGSETCL